MYADGDVTDVSGFIDGCRYTLVLVWMIVVLMVKLHLSLGVALVSDCIHCLVTP